MARRRSDLRQLESEKQHAGWIKPEDRTPSTFIAALFAPSEGSTWELGKPDAAEADLFAKYP